MAATINSVFTLASSSGSDPLSIRIAPTFAIGDPTGSGSITTTTATNDSVAGDCILLAPACASFDQFKDFEERGKKFVSLVENIKN